RTRGRRVPLSGPIAIDRPADAQSSGLRTGRTVVEHVLTQPTEDRQQPLSSTELAALHAWWRACNYLSVGMIYLKDNPLLRRPLSIEDVKHRLLGHWGA